MTAPIFDPTSTADANRFNAAEQVMNEYLWIMRWETLLADDPVELNAKALAQLPHHYAALERLVPGELAADMADTLSALLLARFGQVWTSAEIPVDLAEIRERGKAFRATLTEKLPTITATEIVWDSATQRQTEVVRKIAKSDQPEIVDALPKARTARVG